MTAGQMSPFLANAQRLVAKIITLRSNPHYRMGDVVYSKGWRFEDSGKNVLALPKFEGTILREYLSANGGVGQPPNMPLLWKLTNIAAESGKYTLPGADELAIHIRAGDVVEHDWFLQRDFAAEIGRYRNVKKCRFVICFAFQEFHEKQWWLFTEEKLQRNVAMVTDLFADLLSRFPNIDFDVVSSVEIDRDFVYLAMAPFFIRDGGGFSDLVVSLREYRRSELTAPGEFVDNMRRIGFEAPLLPINRSIVAGDPAAAPFFANGWHAPEGTHRWTATAKAELIFAAPPTDSDVILRLRARTLVEGPPISTFTNDKRVAARMSENGDDLLIPIGREAGFTSVALAVNACHSPKSLGMNDDPRELGILLEGFELVHE